MQFEDIKRRMISTPPLTQVALEWDRSSMEAPKWPSLTTILTVGIV